MEQFKTHLSIRVNQAYDMSDEGYHRWGRTYRNKLHRKVYRTKLIFSKKDNNPLPIKHLETDDAIGKFLLPFFDDGDELQVFGYSHGKTKESYSIDGKPQHVKLCLLAKVKILDKEKEKFQVTDTWRLNRYWFRRPKSRQKRGL